jgi:ankyrin repeat protein
MKIRFKLVFAGFAFVLLSATVVSAQDIFMAVQAGDLAKVKALVEKDPGLVRAVDNSGKTPLHIAAEMGRKEAAAYLIEKGAVVDQKDAMNRTPLWWCAARSASLEVAGLLLDRGADINATDGGWGPPLVIAAFSGPEAMVDYLLDRGAALPAANDRAIDQLLTPAAERGLVKLMKRLIATGVNIQTKDEAGTSLMHKAAAGGSPEIIEIFVQAGLSSADANSIGWTPLHYASEAGRLKAVEMLLAKGAPLDARTKEGKTAFNLAREWNRKDVADFLAAKGADRSEPKFPVLTGPYLGQKLPGKTPELFAPGIVAAKYAFHGGVSFSPDGREAYWSVQDYGGAMASLESKTVAGRWTMPKPMSFVALGRSDDVPFPSPDGRELYFVSNRPLDKGGRGGKENIWVMEKTGAGWSNPRPLPPIVNSMNLHWQVSVDLKRNLYFGGSEEGRGYGLQDIYCSRYENGTYAKPENLGGAINGPGFDHSPFIAPDGSYLIYSRNNPQGRGDSLFISFLKKDGTWTRSSELNSVMGYRARSMCPWVTPDGKYLFFAGIVAGENMPFWAEAAFIEDLRKIALLPSASAIIQATLEKDGLEAARAKFKELRAKSDQYGFSERDFNSLGYRFMQGGRLPEAIAVLQMNAELFPASWNAYDSLAEADLYGGDIVQAEANYKLSLAKNPGNENARRILARMELERKSAFKPGQQTGLKGPYLGQTPPGKTPQLFAPGIFNLIGVSNYSPSFSADGKELYFTRARGREQVIMVCREETDGWTAPAPATFSAGSNAHEPHVTLDNKRVYWGWFRPVPAGEPKAPTGDVGIYMSERTSSGWSPAKYVGQGMFVSSSRDGEIYVTDTSEAPQGNGYLARAVMADGRFAKLERLQGGIAKYRETVKWIAHPCIAPDGSYILFDNGNGQMQVSFRNQGGEWGSPIDLTRRGIDPNGGIASITPDGKYLFYRAGSDTYWVSTAVIEEARPGARSSAPANSEIGSLRTARLSWMGGMVTARENSRGNMVAGGHLK